MSQALRMSTENASPSNVCDEEEAIEINRADGTFFMSYEDWLKYFTHLFVGIDFPDEWSGVRVAGEWTDESSGGNDTKKTWKLNPKVWQRLALLFCIGLDWISVVGYILFNHLII